ncbi:hypothetical protein BC827DRAFT_972425 [Russula dissimulans]|nr:hypothetical protein BC827DRAFT_972425 [Russula dissimulans]
MERSCHPPNSRCGVATITPFSYIIIFIDSLEVYKKISGRNLAPSTTFAGLELAVLRVSIPRTFQVINHHVHHRRITQINWTQNMQSDDTLTRPYCNRIRHQLYHNDALLALFDSYKSKKVCGRFPDIDTLRLGARYIYRNDCHLSYVYHPLPASLSNSCLVHP